MTHFEELIILIEIVRPKIIELGMLKYPVNRNYKLSTGMIPDIRYVTGFSYAPRKGYLSEKLSDFVDAEDVKEILNDLINVMNGIVLVSGYQLDHGKFKLLLGTTISMYTEIKPV